MRPGSRWPRTPGGAGQSRAGKPFLGGRCWAFLLPPHLGTPPRSSGFWRELSVAEVRPGCCGEEGFVLGGLPACLCGPLMSDAGYLIKARHHLTDVCSECVTSAKVLPQPDADGGSGGGVKGGAEVSNAFWPRRGDLQPRRLGPRAEAASQISTGCQGLCASQTQPRPGQPRDPQGLVQNENTGSTVQK